MQYDLPVEFYQFFLARCSTNCERNTFSLILVSVFLQNILQKCDVFKSGVFLCQVWKFCQNRQKYWVMIISDLVGVKIEFDRRHSPVYCSQIQCKVCEKLYRPFLFL